MKKQQRKRILHTAGTIQAAASYTLVLAVLVLAASPRQHVTAENWQAPVTVQASISTPATPAPVPVAERVISRVAVSTLSIDSAVSTQAINYALTTWPVEDFNASMMSEFSRPDRPTGATIIYGHNSRKVFGNLLKAKGGEAATVTFTDGTTKSYRLTSIQYVSATDLTVLKEADQGSPRLILMTCAGKYYEQRILTTFTPMEGQN